MADRLDVVAVRVEHEAGVVMRVVDEPDARRAVVRAAGGQRGAMECIHALAAVCAEGDVDAWLERCPFDEPELPGRVIERPQRRFAVADGIAEVAPRHMAEGGQHGFVEALAAGEVRDLEAGVIDHAGISR